MIRATTTKSDTGSASTLLPLLRADSTVLIRNRRSLIVSVALPVLILVTTNSQKSQTKLGGSAVVIALAIIYGLVATSISGYALTVARDREKGVFQRLRVTPAPTWTIMTSRLIIQVAANFIIALVVVVVGSELHRVSFDFIQYIEILTISIIVGAVFLSIGQALVGLLKSAEMINAAARVVFVALIFLGIFGVTGALGPTVQSIATWSPVGTSMTLFISILVPHEWNGHAVTSLLGCIAYIVIFSTLGIRWFRWNAP